MIEVTGRGAVGSGYAPVDGLDFARHGVETVEKDALDHGLASTAGHGHDEAPGAWGTGGFPLGASGLRDATPKCELALRSPGVATVTEQCTCAGG
jgi:hypothetical protein